MFYLIHSIKILNSVSFNVSSLLQIRDINEVKFSSKFYKEINLKEKISMIR